MDSNRRSFMKHGLTSVAAFTLLGTSPEESMARCRWPRRRQRICRQPLRAIQTGISASQSGVGIESAAHGKTYRLRRAIHIKSDSGVTVAVFDIPKLHVYQIEEWTGTFTKVDVTLERAFKMWFNADNPNTGRQDPWPAKIPMYLTDKSNGRVADKKIVPLVISCGTKDGDRTYHSYIYPESVYGRTGGFEVEGFTSWWWHC